MTTAQPIPRPFRDAVLDAHEALELVPPRRPGWASSQAAGAYMSLLAQAADRPDVPAGGRAELNDLHGDVMAGIHPVESDHGRRLLMLAADRLNGFLSVEANAAAADALWEWCRRAPYYVSYTARPERLELRRDDTNELVAYNADAVAYPAMVGAARAAALEVSAPGGWHPAQSRLDLSA